jgi:hypothetical protein
MESMTLQQIFQKVKPADENIKMATAKGISFVAFKGNPSASAS